MQPFPMYVIEEKCKSLFIEYFTCRNSVFSVQKKHMAFYLTILLTANGSRIGEACEVSCIKANHRATSCRMKNAANDKLHFSGFFLQVTVQREKLEVQNNTSSLTFVREIAPLEHRYLFLVLMRVSASEVSRINCISRKHQVILNDLWRR